MERMDLTKYENHTPGPWWWADDSCVMAKGAEIFRPVCVDGRMELSHDGDYFEVGSNRALLADAPALLSALEAAYAEIDRMRSGGWVKVKDAPNSWAGENVVFTAGEGFPVFQAFWDRGHWYWLREGGGMEPIGADSWLFLLPAPPPLPEEEVK